MLPLDVAMPDGDRSDVGVTSHAHVREADYTVRHVYSLLHRASPVHSMPFSRHRMMNDHHFIDYRIVRAVFPKWTIRLAQCHHGDHVGPSEHAGYRPASSGAFDEASASKRSCTFGARFHVRRWAKTCFTVGSKAVREAGARGSDADRTILTCCAVGETRTEDGPRMAVAGKPHWARTSADSRPEIHDATTRSTEAATRRCLAVVAWKDCGIRRVPDRAARKGRDSMPSATMAQGGLCWSDAPAKPPMQSCHVGHAP